MDLIPRLQADYPSFSFIASDRAYWSPQAMQIFYVNSEEIADLWALLHELGHALLGHTSYETDIALLKKETAAWAEGERLADRYHVKISDEHIQDCLDTYRNWLHARSTCPKCHAQGMQNMAGRYNCINCKSMWAVSSERFCRPYRRLART